MSVKSQAERIKEGLYLLEQVRGTGILQTNPGYIELKEKMAEWMRMGPAWSGVIFFPDCDRKAKIVLPAIAGRPPTVHLRAP
jgi:hypothetical protein